VRHPGHDFDQRRFSCTVLAEDGMDRAGSNCNIGFVEGYDAAVAFRYAFHAQQWF